jgi:putative transposase
VATPANWRLHLLGVREPATPSRTPGLDGPGGLIGGRHHDRIVWSTLQRELLDTQRWDTKAQLSQAIFEWIEAWYNPRRRHTSIHDLAPVAYEQCAAASDTAA